MQIEYLEKYAYEELILFRQFRRADGKGWLGTTETLSSVAVTATDSAGNDLSSAMISGDVVYSNTYVQFHLLGGTAGETYTVTIKVVTSTGQKLEYRMEVTVS